jgi:CspA family cold shock protein
MVVVGMAVGKIVGFDPVRGFGFIAPDGGGEDVFVHAADLGRKDVEYGTRVRFEAVSGARGLKARAVTILSEDDEGFQGTRVAPSRTPDYDRSDRTDSGDDELFEVVTTAEFSTEVTDILLAVIPDATAAQIVEVRKRLLRLAAPRGWLDD